MSIEKHFPNLSGAEKQPKNNQEKKDGRSFIDKIKSLGKKAFPYIAAGTIMTGATQEGKAQTQDRKTTSTEQVSQKVIYGVQNISNPNHWKYFETEEEAISFVDKAGRNRQDVQKVTNDKQSPENLTKKESEQKVKYRLYNLTNPELYHEFDTEKERQEFAAKNNIMLNGENFKKEVIGGNTEVKNAEGQGNFRILNRVNSQLSKYFNTREEAEAFADANGIPRTAIQENRNAGQQNIGTQQNVANKKSSTINYKDVINSLPEGKGQIIQTDGNGGATIYKAKKNTSKKGLSTVKLKEKGDGPVMSRE